MIRALSSIAASGALALLCLAAPCHASTPYALDVAHSTLGFAGTQSGGAFEGGFRDFRAVIVFSENDLEHSSFDVTILTKSVDTGEDDRDETIRGADLFAVEKFPAARFVATTFTRTAPGQYVADGKLTIRDVTRDIRLPFTFQRKGVEAALKGGIALNRLDYGVGQGEWQDTGTVANEIKVRFSLKLLPQTAPPATDPKKQIPRRPALPTSR